MYVYVETPNNNAEVWCQYCNRPTFGVRAQINSDTLEIESETPLCEGHYRTALRHPAGRKAK
jgi:hypothetical protein